MEEGAIVLREGENIPDIIGKPFSSPFEILLYTKREKMFKNLKLTQDDINNFELNLFSGTSAYCNGNNYLFISGGDSKNQTNEKFWKIDLIQKKITQYKIPPKKNHGMIYIPGDYVMIVGGNDQTTFFYDMNQDKFCKWGELKRTRIEPALILVKNILYCFDNVSTKNFNEFTLEKTDLISQTKEWTLVPQVIFKEIPNQKVCQKFFGVTKTSDDAILFLGGNMDDDNENGQNIFNYKYNISLNTVEKSGVKFKDYSMKEKTFLTFKNGVDYILPDFNRHHPEVLFFQKSKNRFEVVKYQPKTEKPKIKKKKTDYSIKMSVLSLNKKATQLSNNLINNNSLIVNNNNALNFQNSNIVDSQYYVNEYRQPSFILNSNLNPNQIQIQPIPENRDEDNNNIIRENEDVLRNNQINENNDKFNQNYINQNDNQINPVNIANNNDNIEQNQLNNEQENISNSKKDEIPEEDLDNKPVPLLVDQIVYTDLELQEVNKKELEAQQNMVPKIDQNIQGDNIQPPNINQQNPEQNIINQVPVGTNIGYEQPMNNTNDLFNYFLSGTIIGSEDPNGQNLISGNVAMPINTTDQHMNIQGGGLNPEISIQNPNNQNIDINKPNMNVPQQDFQNLNPQNAQNIQNVQAPKSDMTNVTGQFQNQNPVFDNINNMNILSADTNNYLAEGVILGENANNNPNMQLGAVSESINNNPNMQVGAVGVDANLGTGSIQVPNALDTNLNQNPINPSQGNPEIYQPNVNLNPVQGNIQMNNQLSQVQQNNDINMSQPNIGMNNQIQSNIDINQQNVGLSQNLPINTMDQPNMQMNQNVVPNQNMGLDVNQQQSNVIDTNMPPLQGNNMMQNMGQPMESDDLNAFFKSGIISGLDQSNNMMNVNGPEMNMNNGENMQYQVNPDNNNIQNSTFNDPKFLENNPVVESNFQNNQGTSQINSGYNMGQSNNQIMPTSAMGNI